MPLVARCVLFSAAACLGACSVVPRSAPAEAPKVASQPQEPVAKRPNEPAPQAPTQDKKAVPPASTPLRSPTAAAPKAPVAPRPAAVLPPPKASTGAAKATASKPPPATQAATLQPPPVAQAAAAPKAAPLDLRTLEERLKDTGAIGVLTKLSLKNQVDDLVDRFRAYHDGRRPPTLAELRPGFELLLMKVLSLLQDKDPALAHDVNVSRDAIWSVLADKQKFAEFS